MLDSSFQNTGFQDFLVQLRARDNESWSALNFVLERSVKYWLVHRHKSSKAITDDVMNEIYQFTVSKLFEIITDNTKTDVQFEEFGNLKSYAIGIAKYRALEMIRENKRFIDTDGYDSNQEYVASIEDETGNFAKDFENKELVNRLLKELDERETAILLRYFQGEKLTDIATHLQLTPENCRIIKHRALQKMEKTYKNLDKRLQHENKKWCKYRS